MEKLLVFLLVFISFWACKEDNDIHNTSEQEPDEVSVFIWRDLSYYYLWESKVDALALDKDSKQWKKYLNKYGTGYEELFESLLYRVPDSEGVATVDRWSWIVDDYEKLEEAFEGISESFGFEYKLGEYGKKGVFGYVTYVIPNSPAAETSLKRGDIFISVDGQDLTTANYRELLFKKGTYELGFADLEEKVITPNGEKVKLTARKITENPILKAESIDYKGTKVGYLVYNSFTGTPEFNNALNDSIGRLKSEGITELVLDLRYNGGGSIYTAILLASMIDGNHTGQLFNRNTYNTLVQSHLSEKATKDLFVDKIVKKTEGGEEIVSSLNSLGLKRLFVLVSGNTASASEMVINGLKPYLDDVILIGTNTHGKYVGSITVYDYIDNKGTKNPNHKWAMQPIILKVSNAEGVTDYKEGFAPDYVRNEWSYLSDIKPLGDQQEPFLKAALGIIAGENVPVEIPTKSLGNSLNTHALFDSKDLKPLEKEMYNEQIQMILREINE